MLAGDGQSLWEIAPATEREKPEQQPETSMYGMLPSCHLVLSHKQALSGPHGKKQEEGRRVPDQQERMEGGGPDADSAHAPTTR